MLLPLACFQARRVGDPVARVRELENIHSCLTGNALTVFLDVFFFGGLRRRCAALARVADADIAGQPGAESGLSLAVGARPSGPIPVGARQRIFFFRGYGPWTEVAKVAETATVRRYPDDDEFLSLAASRQAATIVSSDLALLLRANTGASLC